MRILVCAQEYYPKGSGIANVAYHTVESLKHSGHECVVLSPSGPDIRLSDLGTIDTVGGLGLLFFWSRVRRYLLKHGREFDAIWVHNPLFLRTVPLNNILATVHTTYQRYYHLFKRWPNPLSHKIHYWVMQHAEKLVFSKNTFPATVVSSEVGKELQELGWTSSYIRNGADVQKFHPGVSPHPLPFSEKTILLYVGRFEYQKNIPALIDAFAEAARKNAHLRLVCAGGGTLLEQAQRMAEEKCPGKVSFMGKVPYTEIPSLYSAADFYIMSSVYEGQPLTVLEAMAAGLPCILNDIPNLAELVHDSGCGLVTDFSDVEVAGRSIAEYTQRVHLEREGAHARSFAEKCLDWNLIAKEYEARLLEVSGEVADSGK